MKENSLNVQNNKTKRNTFASFFRKHIGDKKYLKGIAKIAIPVYLSYILALVVSVVDSIMIAPLGSDKIAAVNAALEVNFFAVTTIFAFLNMGFIYFTQYHGKNKTSYETKSSLTTSLYGVLIVVAIVILFIQLFAEQLVGLFLKSDDIIKLSAEYMRTITYSWIPFAISVIIIRVLIRTGKAKVSVIVSIVSLVMNITLNYMFINGVGVLKLGLKGVAIATLVSRVVELGTGVSIVLVFRVPEFYQFGFLRYLSVKITKKILTKGFNWVTEMTWALSLIVQFGLITSKGDDATAVIGTSFTISQILFAAHGSFSGILDYFVGRTLGKNRLKEAREKADKIAKTTFFFAAVYSLIFFTASFGIVKLYSTDSAIGITAGQFEQQLSYSVWIITLLYPFYAMNYFFLHTLNLGGRVVKAFIGDAVVNWINNLIVFLILSFASLSYFEIYVIAISLVSTNTIIFYMFYKKYDWVVNLTGIEKRHPIVQKFMNFLRPNK